MKILKLAQLILVAGLFFSIQSFAASYTGQTISTEYTTLKSWIEQTNPDGEVGGLYPYIQMDGYKVLYSENFDGEHETIRIFLAGIEEQKDFSVTYIKSQHIQKGKTVLRRFVGPEPTGWRMDEIDADTLEYLGRQGTKKPRLTPKAKEILEELGITLF